LVVLIVVGVLVGVVVLRLAPPGGQAEFATALQRVAQAAHQQCEQALMLASVRGLRIDSEGFELWQRHAGGWQRLERSSHAWPPGASPQLQVDGHAARLDQPLPQILCDPVGTRSAFELSLGPASHRWRLRVSGAGIVELQAPP